MKRRPKSLCLVSAIALLAACGGTPPAAPPPIPSGVATCAKFASPPYVDDWHPSGPSFVESGYTFVDPTNAQFTNVITTGVPLGLQFPISGVTITLPSPATIVSLDIGGYASAITITALSGSGITLAATNSIQHVLLSGSGITTVTLTGGNNEGILVRICSI
jgi:hypothetical protein